MAFEQFNMFSFFGDFGAPEEEKKTEVAVTKETNEVVDDTTLFASEEGDDDVSEEEVTTSDDTKATTTTTTAKKGGGKKTVMGKDKITLPVTVYGRGFSKTYDALEKPTYNGLVEALYTDGFIEVASSESDMLWGEGVVFIKSPTSATEEDSLVTIPDNGAVTVCDGMLQTPVTKDVIGKDADEISVADIHRIFTDVNPLYADCGIKYEPKACIAMPVFEKNVKSAKLPATVIVCGNRVDLTLDDFPSSDEVTAEAVAKAYIPVTFPKGMEFSFGSLTDGSYVLLFKKGKASAVMALERTSFEKAKDAKIAKVEEKYYLPLQLVATSSDQRFIATPAMFSGKEKVTQREVLELLSKNNTNLDPCLIGFKIYGATDRQFNFVYGEAETGRKLVVSAVSGKKG